MIGLSSRRGHRSLTTMSLPLLDRERCVTTLPYFILAIVGLGEGEVLELWSLLSLVDRVVRILETVPVSDPQLLVLVGDLRSTAA